MNPMEVHAGQKKFPRFIRFVKAEECAKDELKIPEKVITSYGGEIPSNILLHFPNGHEIHAVYKKKNSVSNLGMMIREFKLKPDFILICCYKGNGNFLINIFYDGLSEIDYGSMTSIPHSPVKHEYNTGVVGFKFITLVLGPIQRHGGADIPSTIINRFGEIIPSITKFVLDNGEVIPGWFSLTDRKLYGLLTLFKKQYVKLYGFLLFTYYEKGWFEISIFDGSRIEKPFERYENATEKDVIIIDDTEDSDESSGDGTDSEMEIVEDEEDIINIVAQFDVIMTRSMIDSSLHGVYIPRDVKPNNREWRAGEEIMLRTEKGEWFVCIVLSGGLARFSAGWNKFVRDNEFQIDHSLLFTLLEEEEGDYVFHIQYVLDN